jgi:hypothetical protein
VLEVVSLVVAAIGVGYGVFRDQIARRERRAREALEAALHAPDVTVRMTSYALDSSDQRVIVATVVLQNKGQNVARDLTFGLRYNGRVLIAGPAGIARTAPVVAAGDQLRWSVRIGPEVLQAMRTKEERIEDVMPAWARFKDKLGNEHEVETPPGQ